MKMLLSPIVGIAMVASVASGIANAQEPGDVTVRLSSGTDYKRLFGLPPYSPPACVQLRARAQMLVTPIVSGEQVLYRDAVAAVEAASSYRNCVVGYRRSDEMAHRDAESVILGVLMEDLP
jgi:hypothetical protein